jgi:pSer/pThr/pTyr-binding forkhead associated (FHA) protein
MRQAELLVLSGKQNGTVIPLPGGKFLIGREEDCHLRPNTDLVSRHHCVFTVDEFAVRIRDLGSTNGTVVNGERIRGGVVLNNGDVISIGKIDFRILIRAADEETVTNMSTGTETHILKPSAPEGVPASESADFLPTTHAAAESAEIAASGADSQTAIPAANATLSGELNASPPAGATQFQMPVTGDTQFAGGMQMPMPPTLGYPQMGYPQMMPYGYPGYPQMYPQGMGYPMPPNMYGGAMPGMPAAPAPAPAPEAPPATTAAAAAAAAMPLKLPDPSETGAKPPEPKPAPAAGGETKTADAKNKEEAPRRAEDIIQQYLKRRPTSGGK